MNYLKEKWGVVEPQEVILGVCYDMRNKMTGTYSQVTIKDIFIDIPTLEIQTSF